MKKFLSKKGFTLVELMVVIVIVGILAAVAIPKFTMAAHKAKASEFPTVLTQMYTAEGAYQAETGSYTNLTDLKTKGGLSISPSIYFSYTIENPAPTTFEARATIIKAIGDGGVGMYAEIDEVGVKTVSDANLGKYASAWK